MPYHFLTTGIHGTWFIARKFSSANRLSSASARWRHAEFPTSYRSFLRTDNDSRSLSLYVFAAHIGSVGARVLNNLMPVL